jgi:FHA domain
MPALIVRQGPAAGQRIELAEETVLGRADNEFLQHDTEVSRRHAMVRSGPEGLSIEDLGSSNGTFVNDQRIEGSAPLSSGDVVRLGTTTFEVEVEAREARTVIRDIPPAAPAPPAAPPADQTAPIAAQEPPPAQPAAPAVPPPPGPPPAEPSVYGPPPPPPAAGYAAPAAAYGAGAKPSVIVAAGIILLIVGIGTLLYNGWDVILLFGDLEAARAFGVGNIVIILIAIDVILLIGALLQAIGGIRTLAMSRTGRTLGIVGSVLVIVGWLAFFIYASIEGLSLQGTAWVALVLSVAGSAAALAMLFASGRYFAPRS